MNRERRDCLRDAEIDVLAQSGGRGLTHRAVDAAAGMPPGTAKNYFPTRGALLQAVADRCLEPYRQTPRPVPADREGFVLMLAALLTERRAQGNFSGERGV